MNNSARHSARGVSRHRVALAECLQEVTRGVGSSWAKYRVIGATRSGLAPAKESVGKSPERYKLVEPGTIFYNPMRILLGSIAIVDEGDEPGITSPDYVAFTTQPGVVHPRWFYYWLRSQEGAGFIRTLTRGAVRERMLFRRLAAAEVVLPSYDAQAEFARQVLAVEGARAAAEAQLEAAKALPAAYLRAVFNSPEAKQWPRKPLRSISSVSGGIQKSPSRMPSSFHRPFLTVRNVQRGSLDLTNVERFEITPEELERCRLHEGDLLVVEGNGSRDHIGRNAIFRGEISDCIHQNHVIRVRSQISQVVPEFVSRYLNSDDGKVQMLEKAKTTTGLYTLSVSKVQDIEIPVPSLLEQDRIVGSLSDQMADVERTRQALEAQLATINALPAALLRRAFNGEL